MNAFVFNNEGALDRFAQDFALALKPGDCVGLEGDLGAGKTTFARAVIRAAHGDIKGQIEVPSPTFTLVQLYESLPPIAHMDIYRITEPEEIDELGLDTALENGAVLMEWPSKAEGALPSDMIHITLNEIEDNPDGRIMTIGGKPDFLARMQRSQYIRDFLKKNGLDNAKRVAFPADASTRTYEFIHTDNAKKPLILMNAPAMPDGPPVYDGLPYSQVVHLAENVSAFFAVSQMLIHEGFSAPAVLAHDLEAGLLLLENLGDGKIVSNENSPIPERYLVAAEVLADIHSRVWPGVWPLPGSEQHIVPRYDARAMRVGLSLLPDWWGRENNLSQNFRDELYALWMPVFDRFQTGYDDLIIRDYHSPNIIWRAEKTGNDRIGIIDHQDALIGPGGYDVASLMQDARTIVPHTLQTEILDAYCARRRGQPGFDEEQARLDVATLCAFRSSRLLGLWVRLDVRDGKSRFRQYEKPTRAYLAQSLAHPQLSALRDWYVKAGVIDG